MTALSYDDAALASLVAVQPVTAGPDEIVAVLADPTAWLGERVDQSPPPRMRRYAADLRLRVGDHVGLATFRKAAYVDLGAPVRTANGWSVEIGWRAATLAPLFPVFSGRLKVANRWIELDGLYAPPGGIVGRIADRALLHLAARGTARWFLREVASAAESGAGRVGPAG